MKGLSNEPARQDLLHLGNGANGNVDGVLATWGAVECVGALYLGGSVYEGNATYRMA